MTYTPRHRDDRSARNAQTRLALVLAVGVVLYAIALWTWFRPEFLQTWREADTQTIARHFTEPGASILFPRIDWGGAGPGYVETEFQLYTWLVSRLMLVAGDAEWPGQLVSLLSVLGAAWIILSQLMRRYGASAAVFGTAAMLASRGVVQCATTVQPEALCLLLFAGAWFAFLRYVDSGSRRALVLYAVSGALAMLVKPTAAQLGVASFVLVLLQARHLLRKKDLWIAWASMVGLLALHLAHGRSIYLEYGNTFGVLSGGDSKLPRFEHLFIPQLYLKAALNSVLWGLGPVGALATLVALVQRRATAPLVALLVGVATWTVLALRYTTFGGGNHYHILACVLSAQAVAHVAASLLGSRSEAGASTSGAEPRASTSWWPSSGKTRVQTWAPVLLACLVAAQLANSLRVRAYTRRHFWDVAPIAAAKALQQHARPGDLIVARSAGLRYDPYWKTISNFEDPRVFFLSKTRGWPIGSEVTDPAELERAQRQGARFFVEPEGHKDMPELDAWLAQHATLIATTEYGGKVYALASPVAPGTLHASPQSEPQ